MWLGRINVFLYLVGFLFFNVATLFIKSDLFTSFNYRVFSSFISVCVIIVLLFKYNKIFFYILKDKTFFLYLVFASFYLIRRFVDLYILNVKWEGFESNGIEMLISILYIIIMPISLICIINIKLNTFFKYFSFIFSILIILNYLFTEIEVKYYTQRISTLSNLGVQTLGFYASFLSIIGILQFFKVNNRLIFRLFWSSIVLISFYFVGLSGTRSVFAGIVIIIGFYFIVNKSFFKNNPKVVLSFVVVFFLFTIYLLSDWLSLLFYRFDSALESRSTGRQEFWPIALEMFFNSPLIGNYHIIPNKGYFHNFFLDAFVSTGIIGGTIFLILNIKLIKISIRYLKINRGIERQILSSFFLLTLIMGMFSGNLYSSMFYWGASLMLISLNRIDNLHLYDSHIRK